ncbi:MAG TPA: hypothetical protein DEP69_00970 [Acidimicrobiaceae bacterium]|nr:hypothetical protein [Acidimicrobiaceae bacterium]
MSGTTRIAETTYSPYTGARTGRAAAVVTVAVAGIRQVLGLGRQARHKILPIVTVAISYLPAVVFVGVAVLIPNSILQAGDTAEYSGYYSLIGNAVLLFTAFVAPEILAADRRTGMLALYLSTPLTRTSYLVSKAAGLTAVLLLVTLGPPLLLLAGYTVEGLGPSGFGEWMLLLGRIALGSLVLSALYAALALGITSVAGRRAAASIAIVLLVVVGASLTSVAVEAASADARWYLLNAAFVPFELVVRIFGTSDPAGPMFEVSTWTVTAGYLAWLAGGAAVAWLRYRRIGADG